MGSPPRWRSTAAAGRSPSWNAPRALEPVGAGIALAPNAQRALDTLDAGDAVRAMAGQLSGELRLPGGRRLARTDNAAAVRRFGGPVVVTHRSELIALLAPGCPKASYGPAPRPRSSTRATLP